MTVSVVVVVVEASLACSTTRAYGEAQEKLALFQYYIVCEELHGLGYLNYNKNYMKLYFIKCNWLI